MSETYEIEPRPVAPRLSGTVVLRPSADEAHGALAADLLLHAHNCVRTFGDFHLALSGGSTPLPFYRRLMVDPNYRDLPWNRTHLWIVDERRVPFDDERSNFQSISGLLTDHSGIPHSQVHPIFATADDADIEYERVLRETLGWRDKGQDRLDFVLLGMGSDGHTASLFPNSPALVELPPVAGGLPPARDGAVLSRVLVRINSGPAVTPPDRVTMTLPLINASRFIALLVTGEGKRGALARVAAAAEGAGKDTAASLPVLGVKPLGGELLWYIDHAACPEPAGRSPHDDAHRSQ